MRAGNPSPLVFTLDELRRSADIFAIELLDMKEKHRILFGADFLPISKFPCGCTVFRWSANCARIGCACGSRSWRLREGERRTWDHDRVDFAFCTLFRHALMALGQAKPASKREAVSAMAALTGGDPSAFYAILDLREGKRKEKEIDVETTLQGYVEFVEVATSQLCSRVS